MSDPFEARLSTMFDDAPEMADASDFLIGVERKLEAKRARRRALGLLLAGAGALAASVALAGTGISSGFADLLISAGPRVGAMLPSFGDPERQAQLGWTLLGLALLAAGTGLSRAMEEA